VFIIQFANKINKANRLAKQFISFALIYDLQNGQVHAQINFIFRVGAETFYSLLRLEEVVSMKIGAIVFAQDTVNKLISAKLAANGPENAKARLLWINK
jgi:hypothetical protein